MAAKGMIEPFESAQVRTGQAGKVISYGVSSYGYDVRCAPRFKVFTNINSATVDPKRSMSAASSMWRGRSASSRPTPSPWPPPSSTFASRRTC